MNKKRWQAGLCILGLAILLGLPSMTLAAVPNLMGVWTGTVPSITTDGCSNVSVNLAITHECFNQVSGNLLVAGNVIFGSSAPIPVTGGIAGVENTNPWLNLNGFITSTTGFTSINLSGNYVTGNIPSITIQNVNFGGNFATQSIQYDSFVLVKQQQ